MGCGESTSGGSHQRISLREREIQEAARHPEKCRYHAILGPFSERLLQEQKEASRRALSAERDTAARNQQSLAEQNRGAERNQSMTRITPPPPATQAKRLHAGGGGGGGGGGVNSSTNIPHERTEEGLLTLFGGTSDASNGVGAYATGGLNFSNKEDKKAVVPPPPNAANATSTTTNGRRTSSSGTQHPQQTQQQQQNGLGRKLSSGNMRRSSNDIAGGGGKPSTTRILNQARVTHEDWDVDDLRSSSGGGSSSRTPTAGSTAYNPAGTKVAATKLRLNQAAINQDEWGVDDLRSATGTPGSRQLSNSNNNSNSNHNQQLPPRNSSFNPPSMASGSLPQEDWEGGFSYPNSPDRAGMGGRPSSSGGTGATAAENNPTDSEGVDITVGLHFTEDAATAENNTSNNGSRLLEVGGGSGGQHLDRSRGIESMTSEKAYSAASKTSEDARRGTVVEQQIIVPAA